MECLWADDLSRRTCDLALERLGQLLELAGAGGLPNAACYWFRRAVGRQLMRALERDAAANAGTVLVHNYPPAKAVGRRRSRMARARIDRNFFHDVAPFLSPRLTRPLRSGTTWITKTHVAR